MEGGRAEQILENETFKNAVAGAKQRLKDQWATEKDPTKREGLWHDLQGIDRVTRELEAIKGHGVISRNAHERANKGK